MKLEHRSKVVGKCTITTEVVQKIRKTKNTTTEYIKRSTENAILLDCGHKISVLLFKKAPTKNTRCYECSSNLSADVEKNG